MTLSPKRSPALARARRWSGVVVHLGIGALAVHGANGPPRMLLLDGVSMASGVVAVGERGTIVRSDPHARNWRPAATPVLATLTGISFAADERRGWAVGHDAVILGTNDGGDTWQRQFQGENLEDSFLDVLALDGQHAIAVGAYGLFMTTADAGKSWARRNVQPEDHHLNRISRGPTGTLYLAGEHGTLLRSTDQGANWKGIPAPYEGSFYGILPLDRQTLLAYGLRGHVFRSSDDGTSWTRVAAGAPVLLSTALRQKGGGILLAGHARTLLQSADGAGSFAPLPSPPATSVAELLELRDGRILALGEAGTLVLAPVAARPPAQ